MTIQQQIKFLKDKLETGVFAQNDLDHLLAILDSLEVLQKTYVSNKPGVVVHMDSTTYKQFQSFQQFQEFTKKQEELQS